MNVQKSLMILVPTLAAIGTLVLSLGQPQRAITYVAIFAVVCSVVFTDALQWFRLPTLGANIAAIVALLFTFSKFTSMGSESQLISVADLLVYLQTVLLFQAKSLRVHWQIFLLSLLEVVVAAALSLGLQFGFLLVLYMFLAIATATLLFIRSESSSSDTSNAVLPNPTSSTKQQAARASTEAMAVQFVVRTSFNDAAVSESENLMLNRQLIWRIAGLGTSTLALTTLLFFLVPRFGDEPRNLSGRGEERTVGFSPRVRLGQVGQVSENPELVMRAQFTTLDGNPFSVLTEPYFRGSVLAHYRRGTWMDDWTDTFFSEIGPLSPMPTSVPVVTQTIVLETGEHLFSVAPIYRSGNEESEVLGCDPYRQLLAFRGEGRRRSKRYSVTTAAFRNGMQRVLYPLRSGAGIGKWRKAELQEFNEELFPGLKQKADQIVARAGLADDDHRGIAKALEVHFLTSSDYTYTLNQVDRKPARVDPIEYFVTEQRAGHCEYFASALVMMLRSQEIPARLVLGFRGGEYNAMGHYFLVRQLHAHAWVEVYLGPDQVDENMLLEGESSRMGAWMTLDPTPGNDSIVALSPAGWRERWSHLGDFLELLWKDYVVGLDSNRQRKAIYVPLVESTSASIRDVIFNPEWWRVFVADLIHRMGLDSVGNFRKQWINWRSVPLLAALLFAGLLCRPIPRLLWQRLAPFWRSRRTRRHWFQDPHLLWYARLERTLARRGFRRRTEQTPKEFLLSVVDAIAADHNTRRMANRLADDFYRIRFGHIAPDSDEFQALEQAAQTFREQVQLT